MQLPWLSDGIGRAALPVARSANAAGRPGVGLREVVGVMGLFAAPITPKVVEEDTIPEALDPSRRQLRQT